jgi:tellurite resistance protein TerC
MHVSTTVWLATVAGLVLLLAADLLLAVRRPHEPSHREAALWTAAYVSLALLFGVGVAVLAGPQHGGEFVAGWLTEYSLSVDNLFVFLVLLTRFGVPRENQQKVLLVGIALALLLRGAFIAVGAAAIERFSWVFYAFGAFLLWTAWTLVRGKDSHDVKDNLLLRGARRVLPTTDEYDGARLVTRRSGRLLVTPMLVVMLAIGTTDLLFALDSIPAIFGLTKAPYLVFTANVFALLGLRQLFFLLGGLLDRLRYLGVGLSVVLAFIGAKLVLEALHTNALPFVNGGQPVGWAPEIPVWLSLAVIVATLAVTTVVSLAVDRRDRRRTEPARDLDPAEA